MAKQTPNTEFAKITMEEYRSLLKIVLSADDLLNHNTGISKEIIKHNTGIAKEILQERLDEYQQINPHIFELQLKSKTETSHNWLLKAVNKDGYTTQRKTFSTKDEIVNYIIANIRHLNRFQVFNGTQKYLWIDSERKLVTSF